VRTELVMTGLGVTTPIGIGRESFVQGLFEGRHAFGLMRRPGRQKDTAFMGAELPELERPAHVSERLWRGVSLTSHAALITVSEAWDDAQLNGVDPQRIGLIVGGTNLQQREQVLTHERSAGRLSFLRPSYALTFMDTDVCAACTQQFSIRAGAHTVGGASASGQLAIIEAIKAVASGDMDVCIALGALTDISYWECQAFRSLGAMGSDRFAAEPSQSMRPFDRRRDGFIFGESCAAIVVESAESAARRAVRPYADIRGWAVTLDGARTPDSSAQGEMQAIQRALTMAGLPASHIDYVNAHGTGSISGDEAEVRALRESGLAHAFVNATKSLTGHGLSAAGAVEMAAVLLQMSARQLHGSRNLEEPIAADINWVRAGPVAHAAKHALNLSYGFGGINTAICVSRPASERNA
jgi:malonyl-ACP decarboxylase